MEYKYIIQDIPPSNNKFIGRSNKWEYQKDKKRVGESYLVDVQTKTETTVNWGCCISQILF